MTVKEKVPPQAAGGLTQRKATPPSTPRDLKEKKVMGKVEARAAVVEAAGRRAVPRRPNKKRSARQEGVTVTGEWMQKAFGDTWFYV